MNGQAQSTLRDALQGFTYLRDSGVRSFAIVVAALVYAVELGSFSLSVDEELFAYEPAPWSQWEIGHGRWALAFLRYALPPIGDTPFLPTAIFCAGLVLSALLLAGCYARSRTEAFAFVALFVSSPIWLHIAAVSPAAWPVGLALTLCAGAIALVHFGGKRAILPAGVLGSLALGIYQALLPLIACGMLLSALVRMREAHGSEPPTMKDLVRYVSPGVASTVVALVAYAAVARVVLALSDRSLSYVTQHLRWEAFLSSATYQTAIARTLGQMSGFMIGSDPTFIRWRWGILSLLPVLLGVCVAIMRTLRPAHRHWRGIWISSALVFAFGLCAAAPIIASAGTAPTRTLMALPLGYAAGAAYLMKNHWLDRRPHWVLLSLALLVNAWIGGAFFNAEAIARERDRVMATQIAERLADLPGVDRMHPRMLIVYGRWVHENGGPALRVEWFGTSFFEQDGGNPWRVERYLRLLGIDGLEPAYISCAGSDLPAIERLPSWPAPGSVALVSEKVVIKFGPMSVDQQENWRSVPCNV